MAHANDMTNLLNKIERRLGLLPLTPHLPEKFGKGAWAEVIKDQTLTTFSRYFPWKVPFVITDDIPKRNGWYIIDEEKYFGGTGILLGVQDIDWNDFSANNLSVAQIAGYGNYIDFYGSTDKSCDKSFVDMSGGIFIDDNVDCLRTSNAKVKILIKNNVDTKWNEIKPNEEIYVVNTWDEILEIIDFFYKNREMM